MKTVDETVIDIIQETRRLSENRFVCVKEMRLCYGNDIHLFCAKKKKTLKASLKISHF